MPQLAAMFFGWTFVLLSAAVCNAQSPPPEAYDSITPPNALNGCLHQNLLRPSWYLLADLVLASPPVDSDLSCYQLDMEPDAIAARIWSNYTVDSCHNVASLFGNNDTCSWRSQHDCTDAVMPSLAENYSPETNHSYASLVYRTPARTDADEMDWSNFTLKVFPEEDCEERDGESWISWGGCGWGDGGTCNELPYSVASFRLERTAEENMGECVVAAQQGVSGGIRGREFSLEVLGLSLVALLMLW